MDGQIIYPFVIAFAVVVLKFVLFNILESRGRK